MIPKVEKTTVLERCERDGCFRAAVATIPMPTGSARVKTKDTRICALHCERAISRGFYVVMDGENESTASRRNDGILAEKHRLVAGSDALRFDGKGNHVPQGLVA